MRPILREPFSDLIRGIEENVLIGDGVEGTSLIGGGGDMSEPLDPIIRCGSGSQTV